MGLFWKPVEEPLRTAQYTAYADGCMVRQGETLPAQFDVREYGLVKVLAWGCLALSLALEAVLVVLAFLGEDIGVDYILMGGLLLLGALWLMSDAYVRRICVDGEMIHYTTSFGRRRVFAVGDIDYMTINPANGSKLYDREGRLLLRWESNMKNAPYFIWFLTDHNVSIRR